VGAAAQLLREVAEAQHAHAVAVLLPEHRERARRDRLAVRHLLDDCRRVRLDPAVDEIFDLLLLSRVLCASWLKSKPGGV
jgi:hypothetical protein